MSSILSFISLFHFVAGDEGSISLDDICEARPGHGTDIFNNIAKEKSNGGLTAFDVGSGTKLDVTGKHCFSIIFKDDRMPLDLVSEDTVIRNYWVSLLCYSLDNIVI